MQGDLGGELVPVRRLSLIRDELESVVEAVRTALLSFTFNGEPQIDETFVSLKFRMLAGLCSLVSQSLDFFGTPTNSVFEVALLFDSDLETGNDLECLTSSKLTSALRVFRCEKLSFVCDKSKLDLVDGMLALNTENTTTGRNCL